MSIRKFRFDSLSSVQPGACVHLEKNEENHLFRILRALPGTKIELLDGEGLIAQAEVEQGKTIRIESIRKYDMPSRRIHLYIAPPRRQKMDAVLREAAELGVWRIVPMICEFGVSEPDRESVAGRWNDALFEACKQSGNPYLPRTCEPMRFADAVADCGKNCSVLYYGSPTDSGRLQDEGCDIAWFVGPEGGFSEKEIGILKNAEGIPLRIGNWILRVETAAIAGIATLLQEKK